MEISADPELPALLVNKDLHAPAPPDFEIAVALRGHVWAAYLLDPDRIDEALSNFATLPIERHQMTPMSGHALDLRGNFTVYDAA